MNKEAGFRASCVCMCARQNSYFRVPRGGSVVRDARGKSKGNTRERIYYNNSLTIPNEAVCVTTYTSLNINSRQNSNSVQGRKRRERKREERGRKEKQERKKVREDGVDDVERMGLFLYWVMCVLLLSPFPVPIIRGLFDWLTD